MMMTIAAVAAVTQIVCEREGGSASGTLPLLLAAHGRTGPGLLEPGLLAPGLPQRASLSSPLLSAGRSARRRRGLAPPGSAVFQGIRGGRGGKREKEGKRERGRWERKEESRTIDARRSTGGEEKAQCGTGTTYLLMADPGRPFFAPRRLLMKKSRAVVAEAEAATATVAVVARARRICRHEGPVLCCGRAAVV